MPEPARGRWGLSPALFSAAVAGLMGLLGGVLFQRPALLVLSVPLLGYLLYALWARPSAAPAVTADAQAQTLYEGQETATTVTVEAPGAAAVGIWQAAGRRLVPNPPQGGRIFPLAAGRGEGEVAYGVVRWGIHEVPGLQVCVSGPLGAWRWPVVSTPGSRIRALPQREHFAATNVVPRPAGMIGHHAARRPGDNGELSDVREFRVGDRLRRINWRVSSRTGALHVNSTWSERDTEVQLVIDSLREVGWSQGVGGSASSLDLTVRAASAIAEHYLRAGDRVSAVDLGAVGRDVPAGSGRTHLRRITDALAYAEGGLPGGNLRQRRLPPGSLLIAFTTLLDERAVDYLVIGLQRGHVVVVVDTVPAGLDDPSYYTAPMRVRDPRARALAWRIRLAEREETLGALRDLGVPVVRWRGVGTLDEVLRDVSRPAPRPAVRS